MTVQQTAYSFPNENAGQPGLSLRDIQQFSSTPYTSTHTPGGSVIGTIPTTQINQKATLIAVGITLGLTLVYGFSLFGKLGKIEGGVLLPTDPNAGAPVAGGDPYTLLPAANPNLAFDVWDPDTDALPPYYAASSSPGPGGALQVGGALQLPQPIPLYAGETPTVALTMLPSLLGSNANADAYNLVAWNARYYVTYDDGN